MNSPLVCPRFDLAKSLELADAVIHMDNVVGRVSVGKIAEETEVQFCGWGARPLE